MIVSAEFSVEGFQYEHFALGLDLLSEAIERLAEELPNLWAQTGGQDAS